MEQAVRDVIIKVNPARVTGRQKLYKHAEDQLLDPRALALPDWETLVALADALVATSHDKYRGCGDVVIFAVCTAARIGEISGCRVGDIDTTQWTWTVRRQTTPEPGGLPDKGTKGKRARKVPVVEEIRPSSPSASCPSTPIRTPACSRARAADVSPPPSCATPHTGTTWSPRSATSICAATTSGTPD